MPRRKVALWSAGVCVALAAGLAVAVPALSRDAESSAEGAASQRTAEVSSGSLASGITLSGTLSRGEPRALTASADGVITWLPEPGTIIQPGEALYEVNGRPVFLLPGAVPLWRTLELGDEGPDVLALNEALRDLDLLDESLVDDVFGRGASAAVGSLYTGAGYDAPTDSPEGEERLSTARDDLSSARSAAAPPPGTGNATEESADGATEGEVDGESDAGGSEDAVGGGGTGGQEQVRQAEHRSAVASHEWIDAEDAVVLGVPSVRIGSLTLRVGDAAGGEVLTWTTDDVVATADVTDSQAAALVSGHTVEITLPSAETVSGRIMEVSAGGDESESEASPPQLVASIDGQDAVDSMVGSAVQIAVVADKVEGSLTMPVTALVALAEGGYAVERVTTEGTELVPVDVQLVAEAQVAVSSSSLQEGDEVVIP